MKDPIKVIHKIKNNNKKTIYKVYIFIGQIVPNNIIKILNSISNLDFYLTLSTINEKDLLFHYSSFLIQIPIKQLSL